MGYWAKDGSYKHDDHDMNHNVIDGVPRSGGVYEESDYSKLLRKQQEEQQRRQNEKAMKEEKEKEQRLKDNERRDKEFEVAGILKNQVFEAYRNKSFFKRFFQKRKGNDPYSNQDQIWNQKLEEARAMNDIELDSIIRSSRSR